MTDKIKIADWSFEPETGIVRNNDESVRLENRAATLLEVLAQAAGQVVSQAAIIDRVWEGRAVSPNSIAVVISDLRRALQDDPKAPRILETLPKRGYRLIADVSFPDEPSTAQTVPPSTAPTLRRSRTWIGLAAIVASLMLMATFISNRATPSDLLSIRISATSNETGNDIYLPLSRSVTELLFVQISQYEQFEVSTQSRPDLIINSKLILWNGHPSMSIHAESTETGEIIWSGMARGPEAALPRQVREEISEFSKSLASSDAHQ